MTDNELEYTTDSTPLAAYLMTEGFSLMDTTPANARGHVSFIFKNDSKRLKEAIRSFETLRSATVIPAILIRNYQDLVKRVLREI